PVRIRILGTTLYLFSGTKNIKTMMKERYLSSFVLHTFLLRRLFKLPRTATETYYRDNSGPYAEPYPETQVKTNNRVEFLARDSVHRFLLGPGLTTLSQRFQSDITRRLQSLPVENDWVTWDNFLDLFHYEVTSSCVDSLCGTYLREHNPDFIKNMWTFDKNVWWLICRIPRFLAPGPHLARDQMLGALKSWSSWAQKDFDSASIDTNGDDPYWGSKFFRLRQEMFQSMSGFAADAIASQNLAFIWGAVNNSMVTSFWTAVEIFQDKELLHLVRQEAQSCIIRHDKGDLMFDTRRLLQKPVLQAVYAETLRLRVNGLFVWHQSRDDIEISGWRIPKSRFLLSSPMPSHMDPHIWCTGSNEPHPVDKFWPGRWLKYSHDGRSIQFSTDIAKGNWMPFGGGHHACPGRQFAKMIIILCTATLAILYEGEVLASDKNMEMSMRNFGFGVLGPVGEVPVRIRRRGWL
ncbi:cytochrome P450, partial [Aspergillus steynii IBT 23096]